VIDESLGPYRIVEKLGAGGMGEVYRATDTRLGRDVALKVLPSSVAADEERLGRFEREARLLAALNHPHIAHVYGFDAAARADGSTMHVLAMELVEGEDLSERLQRGGAVPAAEALAIARQIAEALEEAHEKGIVHRDLKPANIKVTPDGRVKVLDFGLAKLYGGPAAAGSTADPSHSPTMAHTGTAAGLILGTAAYMSPEQARGRPVDKRSDIWAFGVVLYEMLTGRRLFDGETVSDVLAGVLTREADWSALPPEARHLEPVLARCLERDPRNRYRDIGDVRLELERPRPAMHAPPAVHTTVPSRRRTAAWIAGLLSAAVLGAVLMWLLSGTPQAPVTRLHVSIPLAPGQQVASVSSNPMIAFSPDGSSLIIPVLEDGRYALYRRDLAAPRITRIEGTEDGTAPFFSPDGAWLGFIANGKLMKVPTAGGRPFALADQQGAGGAAWGADGRIVFGAVYSDGLFRVAADGGARERLTTPDRPRGELGHWWPQILPGGRSVIFTGFRSPIDQSRVAVLSLATGEVRDLVDGGFFGRYVPSGHLLYVRGGRLYAAPFDAERAVLTGAAQAVLDDVFVAHADAMSILDVSLDGTLAWLPATLADPPQELLWVHRDGRTELASRERRRYRGGSLSPDGRTIATAIQDESIDVWTYAVQRGTLSRVTTSGRAEFGPSWSRDGKTMFFIVDQPPFQIQRIPFGSSGDGDSLWTAEADTTLTGVAPDGRGIVYTVSELETGANIWVGTVDGSEPARAFRATPYQEQFGTFSPDGRWLAYESSETGRSEIYVEAFPGPGERFQVSADGGSEPLWAQGSGEIFYRHGEEMRVVRARTAPRFEFDPPQTLWRLGFSRAGYRTRNYDVTPDGQRFLVSRIPDEAAPRRIELVTGWLDELARRVPVR
jgi:serine/threonine protein kinase/Tol biopolymer transport system component